jgi:hypothetical protein
MNIFAKLSKLKEMGVFKGYEVVCLSRKYLVRKKNPKYVTQRQLLIRKELTTMLLVLSLDATKK